VPVELTSFYAEVTNNTVVLRWCTATELNNLGFELHKSVDKHSWNTIGLVKGAGTSVQVHKYHFIDVVRVAERYYYRLKQVDYNGVFEYSDVLVVDVTMPATFKLFQNYPNPFNPETTINYLIPEETYVKITLFDITGREIKVLISEKKQPGCYTVKLKGGELSSGVYIYRLITGRGFSAVKKLIVIK